MAKRARLDPRLIASLAAVYVIWGSTYLAMRIAIHDIPPLLMACARFTTAGIVLYIIAIVRGAPRPSARDWRQILPIGTLLFLGGNGFIAIAQGSIPSGGTAVVAAMMPLWIGVLGLVFRERPTAREWLSLGIGFVGILVLARGPSLSGRPLHIVLVLIAPLSWAFGSLLVRRLTSEVSKDPWMLPAMEMIAGGLVMGVVGVLHGEHIPTHVGLRSGLAFAYLWFAGSFVAFTAYSWLLRNTRPVVATSYAYVNPGIAVLLGSLLYAEPLGVSTIVANVLMVVAIWLALSKARVRAAQ